MFWLMSLVFLWFWNRGLPYLTPVEHEQDLSGLRLKPDISVHTGSFPSLVLDLGLRTWLWLKEIVMLSGQFYSRVSLQFIYQCTWHGTAGGNECGSLSLVKYSFLWKWTQSRSRLAFTCEPSLRSFLNQPPQMNQHCTTMLHYSLTHRPKLHLDNLLVHLSLHSCESQCLLWMETG